DQLPTAGRIAALKDMGFSLADIVRILEVYDDREKLEHFFSVRQKELEALSKDTAYKLTLLLSARKRLRKEENMNYNITLKTIPERYAATVHMTIPRYEDEGVLWGRLAEETGRMNLVEVDPCLCAVTYLDGEYKEENVEMLAWKTVKGNYPDTEHVKFRTLPEVTVASCTYQGSYTRITDVYTAVIAWMDANGYEPAEAMFNIYHISPHETQNPDEFVTEVCYPVKKKSETIM
ncbi:MAG: MerR family transcriptional regulator, partial [Solobacterium sp.]|nr:MerR family transcriptional regulator [Solobacterium sp.]